MFTDPDTGSWFGVGRDVTHSIGPAQMGHRPSAAGDNRRFRNVHRRLCVMFAEADRQPSNK
ncbi:hypothetical protein NJ7G_2921 [Natrinema sp. J7-2]|nr:hypothetical protein NJ7G_2921 [Natrinema sp. J7-2]